MLLEEQPLKIDEVVAEVEEPEEKIRPVLREMAEKEWISFDAVNGDEVIKLGEKTHILLNLGQADSSA